MWNHPLLGERPLTEQDIVRQLDKIVRAHDELVSSLIEAYDGEDFPIDEYGYAVLPYALEAALMSSGITGDAHRMLAAISGRGI